MRARLRKEGVANRELWLLAALAAGAYAFRARLQAVPAAAVIWLAVYVANSDLAYQYFVWGIPFFLLARRWIEVGILQLALALPAAELYFHFGVPSLQWLYVPLMDLIWVGLLAALVIAIRRGPPLSWLIAGPGATRAGFAAQGVPTPAGHD